MRAVYVSAPSQVKPAPLSTALDPGLSAKLLTAMLTYPDIDPVAIDIGMLQVRWYGLSYVAGILLAWWLLHYRARLTHFNWRKEQVADVVFYCTLGIILGGRLGSVLFYHLPYYIDNPLAVFKVWQGGMSFHGGLIGVIIAGYLYGRRINQKLLEVGDFLAPVAPLGLFSGRIGNFINGELWGRPTDLPWGMVFPHVDALPRHPSQLYEAFFEGAVLFVILWWFSMKPRPSGSVFGLFLLLYGSIRFCVEFVRMPDQHIGYIGFHWSSMGQILSIPMIVIGAVLLILAYRKAHKSTAV